MPKKELLQNLAKVHSELADADTIDDDTRQRLSKLTDDIRQLLEKDESDSAEETEPLSEQVRDTMLQFETEYPRLTDALNQVATALSNLGI